MVAYLIKEISLEPRVNLVFGDWLTGYAVFLVRPSIQSVKVRFGDMDLGAILGLGIYFRSSVFYFLNMKQ